MIGRTNVCGSGSAPVVSYSIYGWCQTAGLSYATLSDIPEADMRTLMTKYASVAYFREWYATEPSMIDQFIANAYAMKWIGLRDYICDKLMAVADFKTKALASTNWEYILKDHAPVMTSDTAPYGAAFASTNHRDYPIYQTFDGNNATLWVTDSVQTNSYVGYKFTNPICVKKFFLLPYMASACRVKNYYIEASNDGTNWIRLYTGVYSNTNTSGETVSISNDNYYLQYRIFVVDGYASAESIAILTLQFYGRSLNVSVPKMTSNTAPYGTAFCSSYYNNNDAYNAYKVFDHSDSTEWATPTNKTVGEYVGYNFGKAVRLKGVRVKNWDSQGYGIASYRVEASNDGFSSDIHQLTASVSIALGAESYVAINTNTDYSSYRIYVLGVASGNTNCNIQHVNFFCVDYSERTDRTYLFDNGLQFATFSQIGTTGEASYIDSKQLVAKAVNSVYSACGWQSESRSLSGFNLLRWKCGDLYVVNSTYELIGIYTTFIEAFARPITQPEGGIDISQLSSGRFYVQTVGANYYASFTELWLE